VKLFTSVVLREQGSGGFLYHVVLFYEILPACFRGWSCYQVLGHPLSLCCLNLLPVLVKGVGFSLSPWHGGRCAEVPEPGILVLQSSIAGRQQNSKAKFTKWHTVSGFSLCTLQQSLCFFNHGPPHPPTPLRWSWFRPHVVLSVFSKCVSATGKRLSPALRGALTPSLSLLLPSTAPLYLGLATS
jgi:hypothetical protein